MKKTVFAIAPLLFALTVTADPGTVQPVGFDDIKIAFNFNRLVVLVHGRHSRSAGNSCAWPIKYCAMHHRMG